MAKVVLQAESDSDNSDPTEVSFNIIRNSVTLELFNPDRRLTLRTSDVALFVAAFKEHELQKIGI